MSADAVVGQHRSATTTQGEKSRVVSNQLVSNNFAALLPQRYPRLLNFNQPVVVIHPSFVRFAWGGGAPLAAIIIMVNRECRDC